MKNNIIVAMVVLSTSEKRVVSEALKSLKAVCKQSCYRLNYCAIEIEKLYSNMVALYIADRSARVSLPSDERVRFTRPAGASIRQLFRTEEFF